MIDSINFSAIGKLSTPYNYSASTPFQPIETESKETFFAELKPEFTDGLTKLNSFDYIMLIYFLDRLKKKPNMFVNPPWAEKTTVGVFSSRSPLRPNPIGVSIVKLLKIEENKVFVSGLDAFNNTPLLDIKPYILDLDSKPSANNGWIEELPDSEHLKQHILGIPHDVL